MTLQWCDGFDDKANAYKWTAITGASTTPGRNGVQALNEALRSTRPGNQRRELPNPQATIIAGCAFRLVDAGGSYMPIMFYSDGVSAIVQVSLSIDSGGNLKAHRGVMGTQLGPTYNIPGFVLMNWYYLEAKVTLDNVAGSVEVRLNGTTVILATGVDTIQSGVGAAVDAVGLGSINCCNGERMDIDDYYAADTLGTTNNDFLGDVSVETLLPNGNGSNSDFLGSDGNSVDNYLLVDESPPDTADYVGSATVGAKDSYAMTNMVRTTGTVLAVQVNSIMHKSDAGARHAKNLVRSGAAEVLGADRDLATTFIHYSDAVEVDPNTSAAWSIAAVNAAEMGVQVFS